MLQLSLNFPPVERFFTIISLSIPDCQCCPCWLGKHQLGASARKNDEDGVSGQRWDEARVSGVRSPAGSFISNHLLTLNLCTFVWKVIKIQSVAFVKPT